MKTKTVVTQPVRIKQDGASPVVKEVLAKSIVELSRAARDLQKRSGLSDRALVILLSESSKCSRPAVKQVLDALRSFERDWCVAG